MATWIDPKNRDHRYGVFFEKYKIKVPLINTLTVEEIREFGMPSSGMKEFDTGAENELVDRYVTINEMLIMHLNGIDVLVDPYEKTKDIYEAISDYLGFWLKHIRQTYSTNHVPLEDLQDLDKFANVVYDKAKYQFTTAIVDDAMMQAINDVSIVNFDTILAPPKPKVTHVNHDGKKMGFNNAREEPEEPAEQEELYPPREGMLEMFKTVRARRITRTR